MGTAGSDHRMPIFHSPHNSVLKNTDSVLTPSKRRRRTLFKAFGNLDKVPSCESVCFPIISLIKADNEECESVAPALVPQLHNPSSPFFFFFFFWPGVMNQTLGTCWRSVL